MAGVTEYRSAKEDLDERFRRIALSISVIGLICISLMVFSSQLAGSVTSVTAYEMASYIVTMTTLLAACLIRFQVRVIFRAALICLFIQFWAFSLYEVYLGEIMGNAFASTLFVPLCVCAGMGHRAIFTLAPVQFALVCVFYGHFAPIYFPADLSSSSLNILGATFAGFSALFMVLLGFINLARERTDRRLLSVLTENELLARTDPLTGIMNRRAYMQAVQNLCDPQSIDRRVILFLDLNNFKPLNDKIGHAAGDKILKIVAQRVMENPTVLAVGRLGGDEFSAVLECEPFSHEIEKAVWLLHASIVRDADLSVGTVQIGVSIGYADLPADPENLSVCLSHADAALRRSKREKSSVSRYMPDIDGYDSDQIAAGNHPNPLANALPWAG